MAKKPLKPDRPISSIVFPKRGRPYLKLQQLPRTKQELELAIGAKFLGALAHFRAEQYHDLRPGSDPADLVCKRADGSEVAIQVVEVVDQNLRLLRTMRSSYSEAIVAGHIDVLKVFSGCAVTLVDSGDPPYLPAVNTEVGQSCLLDLVKGLKLIGSEIGSLQVRKIRSRRVSVGADNRDIHVICERLASVEEESRFSFQWSGGGPGYRTDQPRAILSGAVERKLRKRYSKPRAEFWLLAYSTDTLVGDDDPDIVRARQILVAGVHVFDAAWFLYPYNDADLGHLVRIWPQDEPGSLASGQAKKKATL